MATVSYITPITHRTKADVEYARSNQADLTNKHIGAWNYTDANRVCNNLKYASEWMYEQGFLGQPYQAQIKTDWKETDIITYEQLNTMIVDNMNNLKTYSRPDLEWFPIASIANMDYSLANWLERNIDALAKQVPLPPDKYELTVYSGSGSGLYEANTIVTIQADPPEEGMVFEYWSGDHLENIGSPTAAITTYRMPHQNITLTANYTSLTTHTLNVVTYTSTNTVNLLKGRVYAIEADPAPQGKVFHHWDVTPSQFEDNLYEPAATTTFTMPNEDVTLTAVYITKGKKQLVVNNGNGSGWYDYDTYVAISSNKPANGTFTSWSGDTQYLTGPVNQEYNSVRIPDKSLITLRANWTTPARPLETNIRLTVSGGVITSTGETTGLFTEGDRINITADAPEEGHTFTGWSRSGGGSVTNSSSRNAIAVIGTSAMTVTATYRELSYHTLVVETNSGITTSTKERLDYFSINANPAPDGYVFDKWTGDTSGLTTTNASTGTYMGSYDRNIKATYRLINPHTLTVKQLSGDVEYEQNEFSTIRITAETAPEGQAFTSWGLSGAGKVSSATSQTTTFTFGNGDATLTPRYANQRTITVIGGTINSKSSAVLNEGHSYTLACHSLAQDEKFEGWTKDGPGSIANTASTYTSFQVGAGDTVITANTSTNPDKTLTIYFEDPDTGEISLVSQQSYRYGSKIVFEAPIAPDKTTFLTWLGDVSILSPSALASSVTINSLTQDTAITATYFYPEKPEYYELTVYNGYPESGSYASGSHVEIRAKDPAQDWEFYKWMGDTQYLVNPDLSLTTNAVIMPKKALVLQAKYKAIGELPLYRVSVTSGIASGSYEDADGNIHNESGVTIDVPAGTQVTLTADPDVVGYTFDYWSGNFETAGVTDIATRTNPTVFTMPEADINVTMNRRQLEKYTVYTTNATGPGTNYEGTYTIVGNLIDTDDKHYEFKNWTCVDADGIDCISAIKDPSNVETEITLTDRDLWIEAVYITSYKLTVVNGQDTGDGYYAEGEKVNSIRTNTPPEAERLQFDHWDDPMGIIENIYDPTPTVIMKDSVATITSVFTSIDAQGNSVVSTGDALHAGTITRRDSYLINGIYSLGTLVLDRDGCIGIITQADPDQNDDTDDYKVEQLFYGGNL